MLKYFALTTILIFLTACSSKGSPAWVTNASGYVQRLELSKLNDSGGLSKTIKKKAQNAVSQGGSIYDLQQIELIDSAMDCATLQDLNMTGYVTLSKIESYPKLESYKRFINAEFGSSDIAVLPAEYQGVAKSILDKNYNQAIKNCMDINDNISKLVALGVVGKYDSSNQEIYQNMLTIAKQEGYKTVILSAYERLANIYDKNAEPAKAEDIRKKINALKTAGN